MLTDFETLSRDEPPGRRRCTGGRRRTVLPQAVRCDLFAACRRWPAAALVRRAALIVAVLLPGVHGVAEEPRVDEVDAPREAADSAEGAPGQARTRRTNDKERAAATRRYSFRSNHDLNGTGKFYMGREIARVVSGRENLLWLERAQREQEEAPSKMVDELKLKPGMIVADIGAGSGRITRLLAPRVLPEGKVVAVEVQQEMLDILAGTLKQQGIDNVDLVLGTDKSPRLPPESIDLALMVDVYHEFAWPYEMMLEIAKAIKPGGRVVFVEFRMEDPQVPIKLVHKMSEKQVQKEIGLPEFRLKWKETIGTLPWQHMIVFEKQPRDEDGHESAAPESLKP